MSDATPLADEDLTQYVNDALAGSAVARDQLLTALYPRLRAVAAQMLRNDASSVVLQPTELVHETAVRVIRMDRMRWQDRSHFLAICARMMRQIIVDEARRVRAQKRRHITVTTSVLGMAAIPESIDAERLDDALQQLTLISAERARIVELRFFVGLTIEEIAHVTEMSDSTVKRHWRAARAWLLQYLAS